VCLLVTSGTPAARVYSGRFFGIGPNCRRRDKRPKITAGDYGQQRPPFHSMLESDWSDPISRKTEKREAVTARMVPPAGLGDHNAERGRQHQQKY